ncbi:MAG: hypothetical protein KJN71_08095 [Acidimicrobiia bacterium]|nr:hypothetical protein [Acidimicrobiia bacterium]
MRERGAASVVILSLVVLGLVLSVAIIDVANVVVARMQAQAAADAAALAAAPVTFTRFGASGSAAEEAARFAAENGALLTRCRCVQDPSSRRRSVAVSTEVVASTVLFGTWQVSATGRAEFDPSRLRPLE